MKVKEVKAKAKALGLKNTFGLSKAELIRCVQRAEGNFDCSGTAKAISMFLPRRLFETFGGR